jgi:hypothetical protein
MTDQASVARADETSAGQAGFRRFARKWDPRTAREARRGLAAPARFFKNPALWVGLAVLLALAVRLIHAEHILAWDEGRVMVALRELVLRGRVTNYWGSHGPGYLLAVLPIAYATRASAVAVAVTSIAFSAALIVATYALARELFDEDTGVIAAFALAGAPMNVVFSTWVKQDSLMTLLIVLALYLFVRGRWVWAAIPMAAAVFTKEYAVLVMVAIFFWALFTFQWDRLWRWIATSLLASAMSLWYFFLFGETGGLFEQGFFGFGSEAHDFGRPWYHYLKVAPKDLGWVFVILLLVGLGYALWRWRDDDYGYLLPVAWAGLLYLTHSIAVVKGQWYLYYATPAVAMLAGVGGSLAIKVTGQVRWRRAAVAGLIVVGLLLPAVRLDYGGYMEFESHGPAYRIAHEVGLYLRRVATPDERIGFSSLMDPIAVFYSRIPEDRFDAIPTASKADALRTMGVELPYAGQARDFVAFAKAREWSWVMLPAMTRYDTEFETAKKAGGRAVVFGDGGESWAVVETKQLWRADGP